MARAELRRYGRTTMIPETRERQLAWAPRTREVVRGFPEPVRMVCGRALFKAQLGKQAESAAAMVGALRGVVEIGVNHAGDTYRVYYTLKCSGWVHVLYAHRKKSPRGGEIPRPERELIVRRLKEVIVECRHASGGRT